MIRVLHVVGGLNVGGTESWLTAGLACMDPRKYQFDFLVYGDGPNHYRAQLENYGAQVLQCPAPRRLMSFVFEFWRILRAGQYDVIHAHTHAASGIALAIAAWAGVKVRVFQGHTAEDESQVPGWRGAYFRFSRWLIARYSTRGVAVSEEAARPLFPAEWRLQPERWRVVAGGIDLAQFESHFDRAAVRRDLRLEEDAVAVVHVGRFAAVKNHTLILEIARELITAGGNWVFVLVGDGELREAMEAQVRALGISEHFRFLGVRSDVAPLLRACDVFLFPSLFEGYPRAYLEAQAAGLPCVISDVITSTADVVPTLCTRRSLTDTAKVWAESVKQARTKQSSGDERFELRSVSLERSMQRLVECYR